MKRDVYDDTVLDKTRMRTLPVLNLAVDFAPPGRRGRRNELIF